MLWLINRNPRNSGRVQILLSAALQTGWRIASASPEEQALLHAHGFGSGRVQQSGAWCRTRNNDRIGGRDPH